MNEYERDLAQRDQAHADPNPTKPRPMLLFTLRKNVDGSILFTPSMKDRRQ